MQEIIVYIIVAAALIIAGYKIYKAVFAKKKSGEGCDNCGSTESSCSKVE